MVAGIAEDPAAEELGDDARHEMCDAFSETHFRVLVLLGLKI